MDDFKLTPHFTFHEATGSNEYPDLVDVNRTAAMSQRVLPRLVLMAQLLEEIREAAGCPLEIHSMFRGDPLNEAVGGSPSSQHRVGEAADFSPIGPDTEESIMAIYKMAVNRISKRNLMFGQLIRESGSGPFGREHWLHLSLGYPLRSLHRSREILRYFDGSFKPIAQLQLAPWK